MSDNLTCRSMVVLVLTLLATLEVVGGAPQVFETTNFKVGIEYEHSLPMTGGSDRYRHRNNCDPFFVTATATAKKGFVLSYLEVKASVDEGGKVKFNLIRGQTGSRTMVFQLVSNHSDFLSYSYLSYGIREEQYKKITNIISLPMNHASHFQVNIFTTTIIVINLFLSSVFMAR